MDREEYREWLRNYDKRSTERNLQVEELIAKYKKAKVNFTAYLIGTAAGCLIWYKNEVPGVAYAIMGMMIILLARLIYHLYQMAKWGTTVDIELEADNIAEHPE